ncbi:hypothetical protein [Polaribacter sp. IC073]|uniref:hypothetical protein n=1 Tax=Polaribacter sp. IC073 TaxID=2508540 RepID=UPI0011BDE73E|nr:hypothetical protein [Polaribacter sp. IC073]TXD45740.1 hypothetical protein ES045_16170 [Polaribacter sp. IC073]
MTEDITNKYYKRHQRWSDKAINQLFYFNNLQLTLSVGFLAFAFDKNEFKNICFEPIKINWELTLLIISITLITFSVILGIVLNINRLVDFQIIRHINQVRYRVHKYTNATLDEKSPEKFSFWKRQLLIFKKYKKINLESCKEYNSNKIEINQEFRKMRNISHNLGIKTWIYTRNQSIVFCFSIIIYFLSIIM